MDKPIAVGDLVVVYRPMPCCGKGDLGTVFTVTEINYGHGHCDFCGHIDFGVDAIKPNGYWVQVNRLKRFTPLQEFDSIKTQEEITA